MIIAVDFDGTMVPDCFPNKPTEFLPGAKETLEELRKLDHCIILWTTRTIYENVHNNPNPFQTMEEFLIENNMKWLTENTYSMMGGNRVKFPADLFIEDKIPGGFPGWNAVRKHFNLKPLEMKSQEKFIDKYYYFGNVNGELWRLPVKIIIENCANYFMEVDGITIEQSIEETIKRFESWTKEINDWAHGNMDWDEVKDYVEKVKDNNTCDAWDNPSISYIE